MKFYITAAILSVTLPFTLADFLPSLINAAPDTSNIQERIAPPADAILYDVWYGKGTRVYQCNPEKKGFQRWYNVQTHTIFYPTKGEQAPYDIAGKEVGQLAAAPLDPNHQEPSPFDTIPVIYSYKDGSWLSTGTPIATSAKPGDTESIHLHDYVVATARASTSGYLSHAKYIVRLGSTDGTMPPANHCTQKGMVVSKPYTAYFMFYVDPEGVDRLAQEKVEWERMVIEYTPEKLAVVEKEKLAAAEKAAAEKAAAEKEKLATAEQEKKESIAIVQEEAAKSAVQGQEAQPVAKEEAAMP